MSFIFLNAILKKHILLVKLILAIYLFFQHLHVQGNTKSVKLSRKIDKDNYFYQFNFKIGYRIKIFKAGLGREWDGSGTGVGLPSKSRRGSGTGAGLKMDWRDGSGTPNQIRRGSGMGAGSSSAGRDGSGTNYSSRAGL